MDSERSTGDERESRLPSSDFAPVEHEITAIREERHHILAFPHPLHRGDSLRRSEGMMHCPHSPVCVVLKEWKMLDPEEVEGLSRIAELFKRRETFRLLAYCVQLRSEHAHQCLQLVRVSLRGVCTCVLNSHQHQIALFKRLALLFQRTHHSLHIDEMIRAGGVLRFPLFDGTLRPYTSQRPTLTIRTPLAYSPSSDFCICFSLELETAEAIAFMCSALFLNQNAFAHTAFLTVGEYSEEEIGSNVKGMRKSGLSEPYCCKHAS